MHTAVQVDYIASLLKTNTFKAIVYGPESKRFYRPLLAIPQEVTHG